MNKDNNYFVATLRCIAIISLVVWHSYCSYVRWGIAETPLNGFYTNLFKCVIPDANMPLFTFLAGFLWGYLYHEKGKYRNFSSFFFKKVNRLLIPFLFVRNNYQSFGIRERHKRHSVWNTKSFMVLPYVVLRIHCMLADRKIPWRKDKSFIYVC